MTFPGIGSPMGAPRPFAPPQAPQPQGYSTHGGQYAPPTIPQIDGGSGYSGGHNGMIRPYMGNGAMTSSPGTFRPRPTPGSSMGSSNPYGGMPGGMWQFQNPYYSFNPYSMQGGPNVNPNSPYTQNNNSPFGRYSGYPLNMQQAWGY